jgi:hypothetical protein
MGGETTRGFGDRSVGPVVNSGCLDGPMSLRQVWAVFGYSTRRSFWQELRTEKLVKSPGQP